MSIAQPNEPTSRKPLRLWPGVVAAVLLVLVRFVVPLVVSESMPFAMIGALVAALVILAWWLFFSRAPWSERLGGLALMIVAVFATSRLVHPSIAGGGMGMLLYIWAIPAVAVALVAWAAGTRRLSNGLRRASMVASILLTSVAFGFLHGAQLKYSWAVLVIFLVGIALTTVRALTKSVAASFLVHVGYNGTLSILLFVATSGFRHLERLNQ